MFVIILALVFLTLVSPLVRVIETNLHLIGIYGFVDILNYFRYKKWEEFNLFGIRLYIGMFGKGKTLSMTHTARLLFKKYGDSLRFFSNYELKDIPYIPLVNFQQLVDIADEEENEYVGTVVLIDEIENVLSHRNFANFPLPLLHLLTQQRKKKTLILASAQRYFMVDKIFRSITTYVINCNKYWRFQHLEIYDAWDLEQATNYKDIKRLSNQWFFVKNSDYNCYDTECMVSKDMAEKFISNEETLVRMGDSVSANPSGIANRSRSAVRNNKKAVKRS